MEAPDQATSPRFPWRSRARYASGVGLALLLLWAGASIAAAERLTRRSPFVAEQIPSIDWARGAEVSLHARDGVTTCAWTFDVDEAAPTVVLLHPNGGSRSGMIGLARVWARLGYNSIAVTQRAHGDASGDRNDFGWSARLDVLAALDWLAGRRSTPILLHGASLGAAAICFAAPEIDDARWSRIQGLILESPYSDLETAVRARTAMRLPWGLATAAALGLELAAPLFLPEGAGGAPIEGFDSVPPGCRVLLLAGTRDRHAPPAEARGYHGRRSADCTLLVEEVGHVGWLTDAQRADGALYLAALRRWTTPSPAGGPGPDHKSPGAGRRTGARAR